MARRPSSKALEISVNDPVAEMIDGSTSPIWFKIDVQRANITPRQRAIVKQIKALMGDLLREGEVPADAR